MFLATFSSLNIADKLAGFAQFALVLGIMVIVHELGHFLLAKACGVRVEAFAVGFGKRLAGVVHNGTDYRLNLFPVGGYVKMAGMELTGETHPDDPGEYQNHPRWQRTLITLAGPVFNFVLAFVLLLGLYMFHNEVPEYISQPAVADYVSPGSPMARTGVQQGDRIIAFDGQENPSFGDLQLRAQNAGDLNRDTPFSFLHDGQRVNTNVFVESKGKPEDFDFEELGMVPVEQKAVEVSSLPDATSPAARAGLQPHDLITAVGNLHPHSVVALLAYLQDAEKPHAGTPVVLSVQRGAQTLQVPIVPYLADTQTGKAYKLGFINSTPPTRVECYPFGKAVQMSWHENLKNSRLILDVIHRLFTHQVSIKSMSSPIGMGVQVHEAFSLPGWYPIIMTMAMISLNLGIFNLLPIPILDGGMILFLFIESLIRRDVSPAIKERVFQVAFVCILLFAAVVIFNDLTKIIAPHIKT